MQPTLRRSATLIFNSVAFILLHLLEWSHKMTSIASFTRYQCKKCGQIHIKPEYGSISVFVPAISKLTDMKACKRCGESHQLQEYENVGRIAERIEIDTYPEQPLWWQKIRRRLNQHFGKKDIHVTELFPMI